MFLPERPPREMSHRRWLQYSGQVRGPLGRR
jgi:hypothetical protein